MAMDHDEPALDFSEVFVDGHIDLSESSPQHGHEEFRHDSSSSPDSYTVEMLEREISSLLERSADLPSTLSHQQSCQKQRNSLEGSHSKFDLADADFGDGLDLVAVLQAAHAAHAREVCSAGNEDHFGQDPAQETTRSAPTFHSLMAGIEVDGDRTQSSPYIYHEDIDSDRDDENDYGEESRRHETPPISHSHSARNPGSPPTPPGEFQDISDILNHLSDLEHQPEHVPSFASQFNSSDIHPHPLYHLSPSHPIQPSASTSNESTGATKKDKAEKTLSHVCEQCSKSFTRRSDLTRHTRIHTGERPFVCTHGGCNKTFIQRSALHVHIRVHTGEKPHCCEYPGCGKLFGDSSSLARHRRTHTGKRPYKCEDPECDKTFTRRSTLTIHMRSHDPTWESDPKVKYDFKPKKKRKMEQEDYDELEESMRSLTALLKSGQAGPYHVDGDERTEYETNLPVVPNGRVYEDEEDDEEDELANDSSDPSDLPPIATLPNDNPNDSSTLNDTRSGPVVASVPLQIEGVAEDLFPIPLRMRKRKSGVTALAKRKR